jgi:hypothetical protein
LTAEPEPNAAQSFPVDLPPADIDALIARGRTQGALSSDDLVTALKDVELTPEIINALVEWVHGTGIAYVDIDAVDRDPAVLDEVLADAIEAEPTPPAGVAVVTPLRPPIVPKKPARTRGSRPAPDSVPYDDGRGGAADPVRM